MVATGVGWTKRRGVEAVGVAARLLLASACAALVAACSVPAGMVVGEDGSGLPSDADFPMAMEEALSAEAPSLGERVGVPPAPGVSPRVGRHETQAPRAAAGVVTAGDIDDRLNWGDFQRYASRARREMNTPALVRRAPVMAQLVGSDGKGAPGVSVTLRRPGASAPFWRGVSGVDGRVMVFGELHGPGRGAAELRAFARDGQAHTAQRLEPGVPAKVALPFAGAWAPDFLDLVIVLDTTGSMADELAWLVTEAEAVTERAARGMRGLDVRFGLVTYRDKGEAYVAKRYGFTRSAAMMTAWLGAEEAMGGGDREEASHVALAAAADLPWRRGRGERIVIHIGDAPPHRRDVGAYYVAAEALAREGVQVFGLAASGAGPDTEFLMRQVAVATGGRYLFLTDDSGVGLPHDEPSIACYRVTALKDLLERVLRSELTGRRVEAGRGKVVREVGVYRNGVCLG